MARSENSLVEEDSQSHSSLRDNNFAYANPRYGSDRMTKEDATVDRRPWDSRRATTSSTQQHFEYDSHSKRSLSPLQASRPRSPHYKLSPKANSPTGSRMRAAASTSPRAKATDSPRTSSSRRSNRNKGYKDGQAGYGSDGSGGMTKALAESEQQLKASIDHAQASLGGIQRAQKLNGQRKRTTSRCNCRDGFDADGNVCSH